ncbi:MAG: hypothetical protein P1Q69_21140 [Candidatus Thorarchaeota archaeon]|nr:hypothetical protein [Candidatus Thorarchaeota archaeon]
MSIEVRLATARDRQLMKEFYSREGLDFQSLASRLTQSPGGMAKETMFIIAVTSDTVVAALRLDIGLDVSVGKVGLVQHFEIEDYLESSDLGTRMIQKAVELSEEKGLRYLDALVPESRKDVIKLYHDSDFGENHKEVLLRKDFRPRIF